MLDNKIPIFDIYYGALFFNYKQTYTLYQNKYFNNDTWYSIGWWSIRIGFEKKLFHKETLYCDGNYIKGMVFLGLYIGYGYSYIAKPVTEKLLDLI